MKKDDRLTKISGIILKKLKDSELGDMQNLEDIAFLAKSLHNKTIIKRIKQNIIQNNFQLYSFLEKEVVRLNNLQTLFFQKIINTLNYVDGEQLINNQKRINHFFSLKVINQLNDKNSNLTKNISYLWNKFYG